MILDSIINLIAVAVNKLIDLVPTFKFSNQFSSSLDFLKTVLSSAGYFLPTTAIKVFFVAVVGYYVFQFGKYVIMLIIKYITRLL